MLLEIRIKHSFLAFTFGVSAASACERLPLIEPAAGAVLDVSKPELVWEGEGPVRVQIAQIEPDSGVLRSADLEVTAHRMRVPWPSRSRLSSYKVLVSRGCGFVDGTALHALPPAFFVNLGERCRLTSSDLSVEQGILRWPAVAGAERYRVRALKAVDWAPGEPWAGEPARETVQPEWPLSGPWRSPGVALVVEAVCDGLVSEPALRLNPSP
ncbi:hypothetical protein ACLIJR_14440 [Hydrogenophaga sp. XSHU_21]